MKLPEKEMATHSSVLDGVPWTGKPEVVQSMGSQRVRYELVTEQNKETTIATTEPLGEINL